MLDNLVNLLGNFICCIFVFENVLCFIVIRFFGKFIWDRLEYWVNVLLLIKVIFFIVIDDKFWYIKNVVFFMCVILKGMLIDFIVVCVNVNIFIFFNVFGKEMICNFVYLLKIF